MSNQPSNAVPVPVVSKTIELPEDRPTQLFVLAIGSNAMMYRYFTPERYANDILRQEVTGLTSTGRQLHSGHIRRLASEKRDRGLIEDIGNESVVRRPPNWVIIGAIFLAVVSIIAYGQYNPQFSYNANLYWNSNSGYIVVGAILVGAFILLLSRRRRRPKQ